MTSAHHQAPPCDTVLDTYINAQHAPQPASTTAANGALTIQHWESRQSVDAYQTAVLQQARILQTACCHQGPMLTGAHEVCWQPGPNPGPPAAAVFFTSNSPQAAQDPETASAQNHAAPKRCPSNSSSCCGAASNGTCDSSSSSCCSAGSSADASGSTAVVITVLERPTTSSTSAAVSIYDLYTPRRMYCIMLVVALAAVTAPLSNTIFLPAMKAIQIDLHTTAPAVTSSVASFQVALGVGALLSGPVSDRYGRKPVLLIATALFALSNVPLILAQNIAVLLAFRTLQGCVIAAFASAGPGITADICSPANRGTLFGICSVAALLGPVIGPPLGGGLSQACGWRSIFMLLAGLSALVILPLLVFCVPETLQYKVLHQLSCKQQGNGVNVKEAQAILGKGPPKLQAPWWPIRILCDRQLVLHVLVMLLGYATYICCLTVLPFYLSKPPYSMSTGAIGAAYLPGAVAAILASPCGGKLADLAGRASTQQPLRRLVYSNLLQLLCMPPSFLLLGWGLQRGLNLAAPLTACFLASFFNSLYMPGLFSVLTIVKQQSSAAAVGGAYALLFLLSGSLMMVGSPIIQSIGLGPFMSILAALHFLCSAAAFVQLIRCCSDTELPQPLTSRQGSSAFVRAACHVVATSCQGLRHAASSAGSPVACEGIQGSSCGCAGCRHGGASVCKDLSCSRDVSLEGSGPGAKGVAK